MQIVLPLWVLVQSIAKLTLKVIKNARFKLEFGDSREISDVRCSDI